jgi:hypothetical protein
VKLPSLHYATLTGASVTAISATTPSIADTLAQLISGTSSAALAPLASGTNAAPPTATSADGSGTATTVTLSDQAKAAAQAQSAQAAADSLQAYVEAYRANAKTTTPGSLQSILQLNTESTPTTAADTTPTTGSKVEAIVAQIKALASANEPPPFQPFIPTKSLSNSVTFDGYTLTLDTNASTQFYGYQLSGNGALVSSEHFGSEDMGGGGTGAPPGVAIGEQVSVGNNEAIDAITITQNTATASSASVSSSSAGSISTSSVNAESSSITFLVNYATGQISVAGSAASVSAQSTRTSPPGSALSTLA